MVASTSSRQPSECSSSDRTRSGNCPAVGVARLARPPPILCQLFYRTLGVIDRVNTVAYAPREDHEVEPVVLGATAYPPQAAVVKQAFAGAGITDCRHECVGSPAGLPQITDDLLQRLSRVSKRHRATFRSCSQRDTFTRAIDPSSTHSRPFRSALPRRPLPAVSSPPKRAVFSEGFLKDREKWALLRRAAALRSLSTHPVSSCSPRRTCRPLAES
jgi:hypothetical protein